VVHPEALDKTRALCREHACRKVIRILPGGATRQASVQAGLVAVSPETDLVAVHDGARPLLTLSLLHACLDACLEEMALRGYGAVCAAVPVTDTIRLAALHASGKAVYSDGAPDRHMLWAVQTPQVFDRALLVRAHARAAAEFFEGTDDTQLAERAGAVIRLVPGDYRNMKLTTPEDLALMESLLARQGQDAATAVSAIEVKATETVKEPDA
jgi:2-C-methyl-D-erythritol 4-phosphate cytidylyltransferase